MHEASKRLAVALLAGAAASLGLAQAIYLVTDASQGSLYRLSPME